MLGAIIGDVVGSRFEFSNTNRMDFDLFTSESDYTDDTICTIAVADAILKKAPFDESLHSWCRKYPRPKGGYGGYFNCWVQSDNPTPYGSYGNGSAMRASACGWLAKTRDEALIYAKESAECTHGHIEGIKGALAVADSIWQLRNGMKKEQLKAYIIDNYDYNLNETCDEIRAGNEFDESCQVAVPQSIIAFLESTDFEHAIRLAISLGGDSDTIGAIAGSIAEAYYTIPEDMATAALEKLPEDMLEVYRRFSLAVQPATM